MTNATVTKDGIIRAHTLIAPFLNRTPILSCSAFDREWGVSLVFKCENFQKAGVFKSRGATHAILTLPQEEAEKGVATHSSGNHAQALARAARMRNLPAYLVMPSNSSRVKVEAARHYGGNIIFCEPTLSSRESTLKEVIEHTGAVEIHPYNDHRIIAGQATAAKELFEDCGGLDMLLAPVGGGGLLSGTALATHYFSPSCQVIGTEPEKADDAFRSFRQKAFVPSVNPQTLADGLRTSLGSVTFPLILEFVTDIVTVSEESIVKAMKLIWERMKIIVEPSSAVPFAAIMQQKVEVRNKKVGIILSGGNVDLSNLPW